MTESYHTESVNLQWLSHQLAKAENSLKVVENQKEKKGRFIESTPSLSPRGSSAPLSSQPKDLTASNKVLLQQQQQERIILLSSQKINYYAFSYRYNKIMQKKKNMRDHYCKQNQLNFQSSSSAAMLQDSSELCTDFFTLLINDENVNFGGGNCCLPHLRLRSTVYSEYRTLHAALRSKLLTEVRTSLRNAGYPSQNESYRLLFTNQEEGEGSHLRCFMSYCRFLINLDVLDMRLRPAAARKENQINGAVHWDKIELMDELCKPIVERMLYHFVEALGKEKNNDIKNVNFNSESAQTPVPVAGRHLTDHITRLPEWIMIYMKENMIAPVLTLLIQQQEDGTCIQSMLKSAIINNLSNDVSGSCNEGEEIRHPYQVPNIGSYFLREMVLLTKQVLRSNMKLMRAVIADDGLLCRFVEQMMLFDQFIESQIISVRKNNNDGTNLYNYSIPKVSSIITSHPDRFTRFLLVESHNAMCILKSSLAQDDFTGIGNGEVEIENEILATPFHSATTETLASLLQSASNKAQIMMLSPRLLVDYFNATHVELVMYYLDAIHAKAKKILRDLVKTIRKDLVCATSRPICTPLKNYFELIHSSSFLSKILNDQGQRWMHLNSCAAEHDSSGKGIRNDKEIGHILDRLGVSLSRLSDAMIEDFTTVFIETCFVDDINVASYIMRVNHLLRMSSGETTSSRPSISDTDEDEDFAYGTKPEASLGKKLASVSLELHECFRILLLTVKTLSCMKYRLLPDSSSVAQNGATKAVTKLGTLVQIKFADAVLEAPEIGLLKNDNQFFIDMDALFGIFHNTGQEIRSRSSTGGLDRLNDLMSIMELGKENSSSLYNALQGLTFDLDHDLCDTVDQITEEARILQASGLYHVDVKEALVLLSHKVQ